MRKEKSWFRCFGQGCFVVTNGNSIVYQLKEFYDRDIISEIILCLILPTALMQRQMIMIHGSGLVRDGKAFILTGKSGSGKSTLAEEFLKKGAKLLADDTVAIRINSDKVYAYPAYPQQKICENLVTEKMKMEYDVVLLPDDAGTVKYGIRMQERFCDKECNLSTIVEIQKDEKINTPVLVKIAGAEKIKYFIDNLYKVDGYKIMGILPDIFKQCLIIANNIDIYVLKRPAEGMTVEEQMDLLEKEL